MCNKRPPASDSGSPFTKRFKKTTNIDVNSSSINNNKRLQPVHDFESIFTETESISLQYNGKIPLQPEEVLLYSLTNVVFSSKWHVTAYQKLFIWCMVSDFIAKVCKTISNGQSTTCQKALESLMVT